MANSAKKALLGGLGMEPEDNNQIQDPTKSALDIIRKDELYDEDVPVPKEPEEELVEKEVVVSETEPEPQPLPAKAPRRSRTVSQEKPKETSSARNSALDPLFDSWFTSLQISFVEAAREQFDIEGYTPEQQNAIWDEIIKKIGG